MAAINISTRDQFGESQYLSKHTNDLIELMRPVAMQANKELYSDVYQNIANQAQAMVSSGYLDESEVQSYVNKAFELYMNPTLGMQSGSVSDKMTILSAVQNGGIDNPASYLQGLRNTTTFAKNSASGNTWAMGAIQGAWGTQNLRMVNASKDGDVTKSLERTSNKTQDELDRIYDNQVKNADDFNTTSQKWSTWFENATTWIGDIKASVGDKLWNIGKVIIEGIVGGITAWIGAKVIGGVIGKGIGALAGSSAGGTGAGILAGGSTAGIALGVIGATALAAIGATIAQKEADKSSNEHGAKIVDETLGSIGITGEAAELSSNKTIGALVGTLNDRGGFQKGWGNVTSGTSMLFSKIFQGESDQAKNYIQWMLTSDIFENLNDTSKYVAILTLAMEYANQNRLDAFNKGIQEFGQKDFNIASNEDLGKAVIATGLNKSTFEAMGKKLKKAGWNLDGKMFEDINAEKFGLKGINGFRQGLAKVPYDDYPAILHEGEAVLTSSTANELRNLLTEYRTNNQAVITLDTTIQNQTVELVAKLDEVITAINSSGTIGATSTTSIDQANAIQKLQYSMTHLVSTKSALN